MTPLVSFISIIALIVADSVFQYYDTCLSLLLLEKVSKARWKKVLLNINLSSLVTGFDKLVMVFYFGRLIAIIAVGVCLYELAFSALIPGNFFQASYVHWLICFLLIVLFATVLYVLRGVIYSIAENKDPKEVLSSGYYFLRFLMWIFAPVCLGIAAGKKIIRKAAAKEDDKFLRNVLAVQRHLGVAGVSLSPHQLKVIANTIRLPELDASDILIPRGEVDFLDLNKSASENMKLARETGYTRFPLCRDGLDSCVGLIHIKDVFVYEGKEEDLSLVDFNREIIRFSEDVPLDVVLRRLLKARSHMALVVDDFGGSVGIITLEDVLEELVGDIQDEFDSEEAPVAYLGDNTYRVQGLTSLHDFEEKVGVSIDRDDVSTFGGFIVSEIGRIPELGNQFTIKQLTITVEEVDKKRIISALVKVNSEQLS